MDTCFATVLRATVACVTRLSVVSMDVDVTRRILEIEVRLE